MSVIISQVIISGLSADLLMMMAVVERYSIEMMIKRKV
jgi:hypothetical protein